MTNLIKKYKFKEGLPLEFEIISVRDLYSKNKDIVSKPHRSQFYHIIWVQEGTIKHLVDFNQIHVKSNSLFFIPRDFVHVFDTKNNYEGQIILFTDDFFCFTKDDAKFLKSTILFNDLLSITQIDLSATGQEFASLFKILQSEYSKAFDPFQHGVLKNLLHSFLLMAERERRQQDFQEIKPSSDLNYLFAFKDVLEINFKTQKFVYFYAQLIGITPKRLSRATSEILSKSPKQMIDERVILEAKRLLVHTSMSIKEIADYIGFDEPTNFNKFFRNNTNKTPLQFRESNT